MKNKILLLSFYTLLISFCIIACNKDTSTPQETNEISEELLQQRILQLANADEYGAKPAFQNFTEAAAILIGKTDAFTMNPTAENLELVRQQWLVTGQLFKKCELYCIGDVSDSFIRYRIHRWPIEVEILEDTLSSTVALDAAYVSNLGSHILGLGALEFLLFKESAETTLINFQENPRQLDFLKHATQLLYNQAAEMQSIWESYSPNFRTATQSRISGGQNQMTNALLFFLEETAILRLGKALGEDEGGTVDNTRLEAWRSQASLAFIKSGFAEWKNYFSGNFPSSTDNYGFDDYLLALDNTNLTTAINEAIVNCENAINDVNNLNTDLIDNKPAVEALSEAIEALAVLIKTDLASSIGATITVNDTDGD